MAERRVRTQLAESVLDAAGSLFQLEEELDRISLRHGASSSSTESSPTATRRAWGRRRASKERKTPKNGVSTASDRQRRESQDAVSLESGESCEHPLSLSSSSHYDSAIGSTDNDSFSSRLSISATAEKQQPQLKILSSPLSLMKSSSECGTRVIEARVEEYLSPQPSFPTLIRTAGDTPTKEQTLLDYDQPGTNEGGAVEEVEVMGTKVQLRQKKTHKQMTHNQLTAEDARKHFEWLESTGVSVQTTAQKTDRESSLQNTRELESEGSSSTVVAVEEGPVGEERKWQDNFDESASDSEERSANQSEHVQHRERVVGGRSSVMASHTPSARVNMPHRYHMGLSTGERAGQRAGQRRPPQRAPSILQRLRRRRGSFKREARPQRHTPVQRSLSDRFVYQLKKKREEEDEVDLISSPTHLRPVGRLLLTYTGRLHIIQLHKPPDGQYGIYITQGASGKIFISRFATATAEKFFAGLLSPGDELVMINKVKIRGKSMEYVYSVLSRLDSVIIGVVPVTAHRHW